MTEHAFNSIEDFVFDPSFRDWVLRNEGAHKAAWEEWMTKHPGKLAVMNHARSIVYALSADHSQLSEQDIDQEIRNILQKAKTATYPLRLDEDVEATREFSKKKIARHSKYSAWLGGVAAAIVITVGIFYYYNPGNKRVVQEAFHPQDKGGDPVTTIEKINTSDTTMVVLLPDQSRVELSAGSALTYNAGSFTNKREVRLRGEAFFNVTKMPSVPFLVYTNNMVTKVLGTSFRVKEFPGDKKASVWVKTGKVSVYKQQTFSTSDAASKQLDGVIVIPNQQVTYDLSTMQLTKNIIDKPVLLEKTGDEIFSFHSTPLKEVFATLEHAYGIQVLYDETMISSCSLSANMGNESFYEKLDLICRTINASYESIDGSIFITSHGCK